MYALISHRLNQLINCFTIAAKSLENTIGCWIIFSWNIPQWSNLSLTRESHTTMPLLPYQTARNCWIKRKVFWQEVSFAILLPEIEIVHACFNCSPFDAADISSIVHNLDEGERVEADDGYSAGDPEFVKTRSGILHPQSGADVRNKVRARQETVNQRLKMFQILCKPFRHSLNKHGNVFNAVALIVQISIEQGEPLFQIEKYDDSLYKNPFFSH
mmetsp:Transcript_20265/g.23480  ORF Transcript_20265/g.23480 Transcript_20265/m.23480 type:complete len:215 (-) Transcript_20265:73-717(-)